MGGDKRHGPDARPRPRALALPWWAVLLGVSITVVEVAEGGGSPTTANRTEALLVVGTAVGPLVTSLDIPAPAAAPAAPTPTPVQIAA